MDWTDRQLDFRQHSILRIVQARRANSTSREMRPPGVAGFLRLEQDAEKRREERL